MIEVAVIHVWLNPCPLPGYLAALKFFSLTLSFFFLFPSVSLASFSLSVHVSLNNLCVIFRSGLGLFH